MKNKKLRILRILAEKSQREIARDAGMSQTKYSFIESGKQYPQDKDREAIADVLAKHLDTNPERIIF